MCVYLNVWIRILDYAHSYDDINKRNEPAFKDCWMKSTAKGPPVSNGTVF